MLFKSLLINILTCFWCIITNGGDLVSTWVAKLEVHVEEITNLVKKVINFIVANKKRNYVNDTNFSSQEEVAVAA